MPVSDPKLSIALVTDVKSFNKDLDKVTKRNRRKSITALKKAGGAGVLVLLKRTPILSGRAAASWLKAASALGVIHSARRTKTTSSKAIRLGKSEGRFSSDYKSDTPWIRIASMTPYMGKLERGLSKQAPAGMSRFAIKEMAKVIAKERAKAR